jgi:hypothetical protein
MRDSRMPALETYIGALAIIDRGSFRELTLTYG